MRGQGQVKKGQILKFINLNKKVRIKCSLSSGIQWCHLLFRATSRTLKNRILSFDVIITYSAGEKNIRLGGQILRYLVEFGTRVGEWQLYNIYSGFLKIFKTLDFIGIFRAKIQIFKNFIFLGQKLKILKNRHSHFVELVDLRLLAFFICILVQKCVFDSLRKIGCFWAKNRLW